MKNIVITGASDGVGAATARQLVERGHRVLIVGRNEEKTIRLATQLDCTYFLADYLELDQVRRLAADIAGHWDSIDVLMNNAGGMFQHYGLSADGYERTYQLNHLAPFLLTNLLVPQLAAGEGRVVGTSSIAALVGKVDFSNLMHTEDYSWRKAYPDSKLATTLFCAEINNRLGDRGITGLSLHPGVVSTSFARDASNLMGAFYNSRLAPKVMDTPETSATRMVYLAETPFGEGVEPGGYYVRNRRFPLPPKGRDSRTAARLWEDSAKKVGLD
ncbi:SDR family NAD(P)-dependent oxidoreductase [Corynebacterium sp. TAE3-ERU2]|uniref:SDR family NAD(P)-dependent oxidoreductase n=1 Tax=Corynebacterium sp. TAE3-ERU2 TaxID=2849497 RepID=UPI001C47A6DB|nr:SDR family NAD(P)-dependent oxidoreductase [Corynebacterium sp. TAE3-ERU2]MBV7303023.1 SDR family NAD(P)-dependent oxidoreductase [Corynebacterium sp. TAE3-ERU2]